jgi:hypothetical protein
MGALLISKSDCRVPISPDKRLRLGLPFFGSSLVRFVPLDKLSSPFILLLARTFLLHELTNSGKILLYSAGCVLNGIVLDSITG